MLHVGPDLYQTRSPYFLDPVMAATDLRDLSVPPGGAFIVTYNPNNTYIYDPSNTDPDDGANVIRINGETTGAFVSVSSTQQPSDSGNTDILTFDFDYQTANPALITTLNPGDCIVEQEIVITEPFDNNGAVLTIGTQADIDCLWTSSMTRLDQECGFRNSANLEFTAQEDLNLYLNSAGSTQGKGIITTTIRRA